jgi:hypothetical protein
MTSGDDQRPAIAPEDVGDWHGRSGRDGPKGFAGQSLILKRGLLRRPSFELAGGLGDRGDRLARDVIGSGFLPTASSNAVAGE